MKKNLLIVYLYTFVLLGMTSCVDTVILPDSLTIEEDFWQEAKDVQMAVNGAYAAMASQNIQNRIVIWTMRSDELMVNKTLSNSNLNQISTASIQTDNVYNSWGDLYNVINKCNLVLSKSADVMDIDPNYLEGDHNNYVAQMKSLRALAYFYLIRVFRDVPLVTTVFKESSQEMELEQSAPAIVLDQIINDLEESKNKVLSSQSQYGINRVGYFTRDGVNILLADVYLWKASITGDEADYDKAIECCNTVRNNRSTEISRRRSDGTEIDDDGFRLNMTENYYNVFEGRSNNSEALFVLQYNDNTALCNLFNRSSALPNAEPWFYASNVYAKANTDEDSYVFNKTGSTSDVRGYESVYSFNGSADANFKVRKTVAIEGLKYSPGATTPTSEAPTDRAYTGYNQNWVVYRASDALLIKAEAMVQKAVKMRAANIELYNSLKSADNSNDSLNLARQLREVNAKISAINVTAARQVYITNSRAHLDNSSDIDSTQYIVNTADYDPNTQTLSDYVATQISTFDGFSNSAVELEKIVMDERAREFCFEGKRWFDMLRQNYRKQGTDYGTILAHCANIPATSESLKKLIARKDASSGTAIANKMPNEAYLYMPIIQSEIDVNPNLVQNPVYFNTSSSEKNY